MAMTNDQYDSINAYLATNPSAEELAAAQAQFGVSDADLAAAINYGSGGTQAKAVVAGPTDPNAPAFVPAGGTLAEGYSRAYTAEQLAGIRNAWAASRNDPAALMQAMKDTGVNVKDIALAVGGSATPDSLQAYNNYFVQAGAPVGFGGMYTAADMSADDKKYMDWMLAQPNPAGSGTMADVYRAQKIDPYNNAGVIAQAKAQNERAANRNTVYAQAGQPAPAGIAPWTTPTATTPTAPTPTVPTPTRPNVVVGGGLLTASTNTTTPTVPSGNTGGLLTPMPGVPVGQTGNVSTFANTSIPTGLGNQYSRQYTPSQLAGIKDWWSKTYNNRGQAISDMETYGVSTQDLAMATNQPYQQLANYLKEGGAPAGFGGAIEGAGGLFKRAADMAQQPGIQFGTTQGLLSDPTSQLARNILARDTQYQQTAPVMGSGKWGMPSYAPGTGLLAPDYWLAAKTAEAQRTAAQNSGPQYIDNSSFDSRP
jgi:hypothetical protein